MIDRHEHRHVTEMSLWISYPFNAAAPGSGLRAAARSGNQGRLKVLSVGL
jgi:hypothetical protein